MVTIGTKGVVHGEIAAKSFVVNGEFEGVVESNTVEILSKGKIKGTLIYTELTIEKGGNFEGDSKRKSVSVEMNIAPTPSKNKSTVKEQAIKQAKIT